MRKHYFDAHGNVVIEITDKKSRQKLKNYLAGTGRSTGHSLSLETYEREYILEPMCDDLGLCVCKPEWIGALTAAPIVVELAKGVKTVPPRRRSNYRNARYYIEGEVKRAWWYEQYAITSMIDDLVLGGKTVLQRAPENDEESADEPTINSA
jgi:hypothetical protein